MVVKIIVLNEENLKKLSKPERVNILVSGVIRLKVKKIQEIYGYSFSEVCRRGIELYYQKFEKDLQKQEFVSVEVENERC